MLQRARGIEADQALFNPKQLEEWALMVLLKEAKDRIECKILRVELLQDCSIMEMDDAQELGIAGLLEAEAIPIVIYNRNEVEAATQADVQTRGLFHLNIPPNLKTISGFAFQECKKSCFSHHRAVGDAAFLWRGAESAMPARKQVEDSKQKKASRKKQAEERRRSNQKQKRKKHNKAHIICHLSTALVKLESTPLDHSAKEAPALPKKVYDTHSRQCCSKLHRSCEHHSG